MAISDKKPAKVVRFQSQNEKLQVRTDKVGGLLKTCRTAATTQLNAALKSLFENIDDVLFDLAEKADTNGVQTQYFEGMREIRKQRPRAERLFQVHITQYFSDFIEGKLSPGPESGDSELNLSLIDDMELEEDLAISGMISKVENHLCGPLFVLNERFSVLHGGNEVKTESNPLGPKYICEALREALKNFDTDVKVKLIVYKLFEKYVLADLRSLYENINNILGQAGVLPNLRPKATPRTRPGQARQAAQNPSAFGDESPTGQEGSAGFNPETQNYPTSSGPDSKLVHDIMNLLASRHPSQGAASSQALEGYPPVYASPGNTHGHTVSTPDLLNALSVLQSEYTADSTTPVHQLTNNLKQRILDTTENLLGTQTSGISAIEEDTIDLVSMLFEYIVQDRNIPVEIQALLARLQLPFVKVAMLDRQLLSQKSHPARQLLDMLANAGLSWSDESDRGRKLYSKIESIVESCLSDFDESTNLFSSHLTDFSNFVEKQSKRADAVEKRTNDSAEGKERLFAARKRAASEILSRIKGKTLPNVVKSILTQPWANVLVLTLLRHSEESTEWTSMLEFADDLVWSIEPKDTLESRKKLRITLPLIEKRLREGLALVAYHETDIRNLLRQLNSVYKSLLPSSKTDSPETPVPPSSTIDENDTVLGETESTAAEFENGLTIVSANENATESPEKASPNEQQITDYIKLLKAIAIGTWFEFLNENEDVNRAKLSWISPISSKYLFVNRNGIKVADKSLTDLASELNSGNTVLLQDKPIFDRAMSAIVSKLKQSKSKGKSNSKKQSSKTNGKTLPTN